MKLPQYLFISFLFIFSSLFGQSPFKVTELQRIDLDFYDQHWENKLKAFKKQNIEDRIPARLKLGTEVFDSVAVRFKGNSSYNNPKKKENKKLPFNIDIDDYHRKAEFGDGTNKLKLSNSFRDPSYMREVLSYEIIRNYLPISEAGFYQLFINGQDYGVYIGSESVNKNFLKKNFGTKKGNLFKCDPDYSVKDSIDCEDQYLSNLGYFENPDCYKNRYELKSKKGWKHFERFIKSLNAEPDSIMQDMAIFDFLWMHALNNVLVNLDSYSGRLSHNYYLYRDTSKIWHPIMWDFNLSIGAFPFDGEKAGKLTYEEMINFPIESHFGNKDRPLISQLLSHENNFRIYKHMIKTICEDYLANGKYLEMINSYKNLIRGAVTGNGKKLYSNVAFEKNSDFPVKAGPVAIPGIKQFMESRITYLLRSSAYADDLPLIYDQTQETTRTTWTLKTKIGNTRTAYIYSRSYPNGPWSRTTLINKLTHWEITVPLDQRPQAFFILMVNEGNATLYPSNAPREFLNPK